MSLTVIFMINDGHLFFHLIDLFVISNYTMTKKVENGEENIDKRIYDISPYFKK